MFSVGVIGYIVMGIIVRLIDSQYEKFAHQFDESFNLESYNASKDEIIAYAYVRADGSGNLFWKRQEFDANRVREVVLVEKK